MRLFCNFFIPQPIKLKFGTWIQNSMLILIYGSKSGFGDDLGQYDTKTTILQPFLAFFQVPRRNNAVREAPKVPGNQKLHEKVNYKSDKVAKWQSFSFLHLIVSELY